MHCWVSVKLSNIWFWLSKKKKKEIKIIKSVLIFFFYKKSTVICLFKHSNGGNI